MPDQLLQDHIENLERIFGKKYLYEIGFYLLNDEATQTRVIQEILRILGVRMYELVTREITDHDQLHQLQGMFRKHDTVFDIYDHIKQKIPGLDEKVERVIRQLQVEIMETIDRSLE